MDQPSTKWPDYHIGSHDHLHAVGVLIAAWNMIESAYEAQIQLVFPLHRMAGYRAFELLSNDGRIKLIREGLSDILNVDEKAYFEYFFKSSNICRTNRNVLAHSSYFGQPSDTVLTLTTTNNRLQSAQPISAFSLISIKEMADATYRVAQFGFRMFITISSRRGHELLRSQGSMVGLPPALPEKPTLPRSWDQIREAPTPSPNPPESSPA